MSGPYDISRAGEIQTPYVAPGWHPGFSLARSETGQNRIIATWAYDGVSYINEPVNGSITGVVWVETVGVVPYCRCAVYYRPNGMLISQHICNALGEFTFVGLNPVVPANPDDGLYTFIAFDPHGGSRYNIVGKDRVVAV